MSSLQKWLVYLLVVTLSAPTWGSNILPCVHSSSPQITADLALNLHGKHHHQMTEQTILPQNYASDSGPVMAGADCVCDENCVNHCAATTAPVADDTFVDRMALYEVKASSPNHLVPFLTAPVLELPFRPPIYLN